jgi:putative ABC transport system ATP-binding protein
MSESSVLELRAITKVYGEGLGAVTALDDVDLALAPGELAAVMGPSGGGKTTLLTIAGALQQPTSGSVEVAGESLTGLSARDMEKVRREKVGFVFQSFNLLQALTARENVQYVIEFDGARGARARERATELMRMVGLEQRMDVLPKKLSGGEQQRVCVARALANRARVILADEPTASLDRQRAEETMGLLRALSRDLGCGVLVVTHDARALPFADRTLWLEDGRLVAAARPEGQVRGT